MSTTHVRKGDTVMVISGEEKGVRGRVLSVEELGTAIGNVASHELGHLLGLNHVANAYDLMDTTGRANTLLYDKEFIESPLDDSIFPIGTQDSLLWLLETLGIAE